MPPSPSICNLPNLPMHHRRALSLLKICCFLFHSPVLSFPLLLLFAKEIFLGKQLDGVAGKQWDRSLFPSGWWDSCNNRRRTLMLTIFLIVLCRRCLLLISFIPNKLIKLTLPFPHVSWWLIPQWQTWGAQQVKLIQQQWLRVFFNVLKQRIRRFKSCYAWLVSLLNTLPIQQQLSWRSLLPFLLCWMGCCSTQS